MEPYGMGCGCLGLVPAQETTRAGGNQRSGPHLANYWAYESSKQGSVGLSLLKDGPGKGWRVFAGAFHLDQSLQLCSARAIWSLQYTHTWFLHEYHVQLFLGCISPSTEHLLYILNCFCCSSSITESHLYVAFAGERLRRVYASSNTVCVIDNEWRHWPHKHPYAGSFSLSHWDCWLVVLNVLLINQHAKKKKVKTRAAPEHGGSGSPSQAHRHSGLDGVKNPNRFTDKTGNSFAENCLGYSKKPFLSGVLGQLELFALTFFFPPCQKRTGWVTLFLCAAVGFDGHLFKKHLWKNIWNYQFILGENFLNEKALNLGGKG